LPTVASLFQASEKSFPKMKFGDCSIRMVADKVCCRLVIVRLDGLEHSSVQRL
jgi:hypothetical protein